MMLLKSACREAWVRWEGGEVGFGCTLTGRAVGYVDFWTECQLKTRVCLAEGESRPTLEVTLWTDGSFSRAATPESS